MTEICRSTQRFPREEVYGLTSQLRRAAVSIASNIAEGQARYSPRDFRNFLGHARGSLAEIETQLLIARNLQYLSSTEAAGLEERAAELGRLLNGLHNSIRIPSSSPDSDTRQLGTGN